MGATQNPRDQGAPGSPSSGSTSGGRWSRKGRRTHTPCGGRAGRGPRIAAVPFDLPSGGAGDPRKFERSDGKPAHSEQPGPDVSTTLRHGPAAALRRAPGVSCPFWGSESPEGPMGGDLLSELSPGPEGSTVQTSTDYVCCGSKDGLEHLVAGNTTKKTLVA
jgi:hypothetical protein